MADEVLTAIELLEEDAINDIIELDYYCDNLLHYRHILDTGRYGATVGTDDLLIEYEDLQDKYLKHIKMLLVKLNIWITVANEVGQVNLPIYRVYRNLADQKARGLI